MVKKVEVDWALELGLDRRKLWMEHPGHPNQLKAKKRMLKAAEDYWVERHLEQLWSEDGEKK